MEKDYLWNIYFNWVFLKLSVLLFKGTKYDI